MIRGRVDLCWGADLEMEDVYLDDRPWASSRQVVLVKSGLGDIPAGLTNYSPFLFSTELERW